MKFGSSRWLTIVFRLVLVVISCRFNSSVMSEESPRTWRDAAGKFSIEATLVDVQADSVRLLKASGDTIKVPLAKLSEADQTYIKSRQDAPIENPPEPDNPFASPSLVKVEPLEVTFSLQSVKPSQDIETLPSEGTTLLLPKSTECEPLAADPSTARPNLKAGLALVSTADPYDDVSEMVTLNSRQALIAISIGRFLPGSKDLPSGKLLVGQLPKGPFTLVSQIAEANRLLDHNEITGQTLVSSNIDNLKRGGDLVVMKGLAEGKPVELYRRRLPGIDTPGFKPQVKRAKLIGEDLAIVVVDSVLYCWNLKSLQLVYRTEKSFRIDPEAIAFSGNVKWLAVPQQGGFSLVESSTGEDRGYVNTDTVTDPGVAFHPDGRRIGYCCDNAWGVWDVVDAKKVSSGLVTEHLGQKITGWIGHDWLLTEMGNMIDTQSEMLVWFYYTGATESRGLWNNWLVVASKTDGLKITTLPIPDQRAQLAIKKLGQQKNLMVTSPGTEVRIEIESTETVDEAALTEALTTAIENAGWKISPSAKLRVVAKIGRGKPYNLQYNSTPFAGSAAAPSQAINVEIKPFTASLEIRSGNAVLWTRNTENHPPSMLFLQNNETVEQAVKKYERPQPEFFSSLKIPPRIPKGEIAKGLGGSRIDNGVWADFPISAVKQP